VHHHPNDTENLHPLYSSITQISSLNVQGYQDTAGASADREVSCRFLRGFRVLNRCLLEKPHENLLRKSSGVRHIRFLGQTIHTVWKFFGFPKKAPPLEIIAAKKYGVIFLILFSISQKHVAGRNRRLLTLAQYERGYC